jgi:hypothetical protein
MEVKKYNEVPMSAMWVQTPGVNKELYNYDADDPRVRLRRPHLWAESHRRPSQQFLDVVAGKRHPLQRQFAPDAFRPDRSSPAPSRVH